jgi:hypothetical protein
MKFATIAVIFNFHGWFDYVFKKYFKKKFNFFYFKLIFLISAH